MDRFLGNSVFKRSSEYLGIYDVLDNNQDMYFCGHKLLEFLEFPTAFFVRLQYYLNTGLCFELAALAMLTLKGVHSKLQQGYININGLKIRHAWVEFTKRGVDFIADFAWGLPVIMPAWMYDLSFAKREVEYSCSNNDFWALARSNSLYELMREPKTSYIFEGLEPYGLPKWSDSAKTNLFGFQPAVAEPFFGAEFFCPSSRGRGSISEAVFDNLLAYPKMLAPNPEIFSAVWGAEPQVKTIL